MNKFGGFLLCFLALLGIMTVQVNALDCYECVLCSDPFKSSDAKVVTCSETQKYCAKYVVNAAIIKTTQRGCAATCDEVSASSLGIAGAKISCCTSDKCNDSTSVMASKLSCLLLLPISILFSKLF